MVNMQAVLLQGECMRFSKDRNSEGMDSGPGLGLRGFHSECLECQKFREESACMSEAAQVQQTPTSSVTGSLG